MFVVKLRYSDKNKQQSIVDKVLACSDYSIRRFDNSNFEIYIGDTAYAVSEGHYDQFFIENANGKTIDSGCYLKS